MAGLRFEGVSKRYARGDSAALTAIDLAARDGELLVVVGPSGCGKSTLLRLAAGLETPDTGRIRIGERDVTDLPPQERDLAMVFQSYALYPHKSVRENLGFGLRMRGVPRAEIDTRVTRVADALELTSLLDRRPAELSGGQRQRVALGRATAREPAAFLLDEPLSNLDPALRTQTRSEIASLQQRLQATMLYVTHDQEEAMTLGHRIAVLRDGALQQQGAPLEVYERPTNRFVASFIGSPPMNFLSCALRPRGNQIEVDTHAFTIDLPGCETPERQADVGIRPHDITLVAPGTGDTNATIERIETLGNEIRVTVRLGAPDSPTLQICAPPNARPRPQELVGLHLAHPNLHFFDSGTGHRLVELDPES